MNILFYNPFKDGLDFSIRFSFDYSIDYKYIDFVFEFIFMKIWCYKEWGKI
jgi:hypothetical protein